MKLNKGNKVFIVNTTSSLNHLKSLYVKEVSKTMDESFEITATKRMYGYKFEQDSELMSLRFKLNPYLVFFENRITDVIKAYGADKWDFPDPRCKFAPKMNNNISYNAE